MPAPASKVKIPNLTQRLFIATLAMCPYYFSYKSLPIALNFYLMSKGLKRKFIAYSQ